MEEIYELFYCHIHSMTFFLNWLGNSAAAHCSYICIDASPWYTGIQLKRVGLQEDPARNRVLKSTKTHAFVFTLSLLLPQELHTFFIDGLLRSTRGLSTGTPTPHAIKIRASFGVRRKRIAASSWGCKVRVPVVVSWVSSEDGRKWWRFFRSVKWTEYS